ncbi:hypothetical protein ACBI01_001154 [Aeromonas veronii]
MPDPNTKAISECKPRQLDQHIDELISRQLRQLVPQIEQGIYQRLKAELNVITQQGMQQSEPQAAVDVPCMQASHHPGSVLVSDGDDHTPTVNVVDEQLAHEESYQMLLAWLRKMLGADAAPDYRQFSCAQLQSEINKLELLLKTRTASDVQRLTQVSIEACDKRQQESQALLRDKERELASQTRALTDIQHSLNLAQIQNQLWQEPLQFLAYVKKQSDLAQLLLPDVDSEREQLLGLVATASQWSGLEELWSRLERRCKAGKRPCDEQERALLEFSERLYNLTLRGIRITLHWPVSGEKYDYDIHNGVSNHGDKITRVWLPSLLNGAGKTVKKALVERG